MFNVIRSALEETESLQVGQHALENTGLGVCADDQTLRESFELAQQFLPTVAAPGNMLRLIEATAAEAAEQTRRPSRRVMSCDDRCLLGSASGDARPERAVET